jgi:MraZ protein
MFLGEYLHTFDPKNRISLPARFRKDLGRAVIITRGLDRSLYIYARKAWEKEAAKYAAMASGNAAERGLARLFLSGSIDAEVDGAGRILIPEQFKQFAGIKSKAVVAGVADRVEIWEEDAWKKYTKALERDAESYAEKVGSR